MFTVEIAGRRWRVGAQGHDISIPLAFDAAQPSFFGAPPAAADVVTAGSFVGDVRRGGSCNCSSHTLTPHCNGTHTECIGHVTAERLSVQIDRATAEGSNMSIVDLTKLVRLRDCETKASADKATKLRLTNQARYTPQAAATAAKREGQASKPWQIAS